MTALFGWILIAIVFDLAGLLLLSPCYLVARRRFARRRRVRGIYLGASALCAVGLWFALPPLVHALFGRAVH